jgi:hypothetical protein
VSNVSNAARIEELDGRDIKGKWNGDAIPIAFNCRITWEILTLCISGIALSSSFSKLSSVYNRKHFPGDSLPALPALWLACALDIGTIYIQIDYTL